jgi:hypothetical protein
LEETTLAEVEHEAFLHFAPTLGAARLLCLHFHSSSGRPRCEPLLAEVVISLRNLSRPLLRLAQAIPEWQTHFGQGQVIGKNALASTAQAISKSHLHSDSLANYRASSRYQAKSWPILQSGLLVPVGRS